jgi:hypothetical protein
LAVFRGRRHPDDELENDVWWEDQAGRHHELRLRLDLRNHSPTGFEWGYGGSGPAQLALAVCAEAVGDERAMRVYMSFKDQVVARLPRPSWDLTVASVVAAVEAIEAQARKEASRAGLR